MPIQVLPPQLANQIAAGEVVERPASVVKELVENSLDAGATRVDIEIEKGGAKLIRIRDNGCGISKEDLAMALARHATSKIATLDDLEAIMSLGFRGEALASISSVSRLLLTSRTADQNEAWQAYAEGRDMAVSIKPAAHPPGSTVEVLDLFYNTPARRKFMRTEKTEFTHIDEIIRRIALARFDVSFSLSHNGKLVRQYRAVSETSQRERRLGSICGTTFLNHALAIEWQHGDLSLNGWVVDPTASGNVSDLQYCYVNGRMMRDRLINHAIRQSCQDKLTDDRQAAYVLYLQIDPHQVDVNVHPAKHEVRFHQSRLVHDFIYQGVSTALQKTVAAILTQRDEPIVGWQPENRQAAGTNRFAVPPAPKTSVVQESQPPRYQPVISADAGTSQERWQRQTPVYQKREGSAYQQLLQTPVLPDETNRHAVSTQHDDAPADVGQAPLSGHSQSFGRLLTVVQGVYALVEGQERLALISLTVAERRLKEAQLAPGKDGLKAQPLLIPVRIKLEKSEHAALERYATLLIYMGIELLSDEQHVTLRGVPLPLRQQNLQNLIPELLGYLARHHDVSATQVAQWLARSTAVQQTGWNHSQAIALLAEVERLCPQLTTSPPSELLQHIDIEQAMNALKHD
ncbi:DNA mismatch repair endonuclease MutL [Erwinia tracheiphila]|uniref:DNA mismatch repair protein MutL n=1 Tax=Erwinia tracheiphila TaxID=65700 RepID=A0A345CVC9_9GAMM|nr:DNA mismatch repair endonuclease MutL [Erwinia tracheiphila]AXF77396.1 DNA mismatch repair endonuclease MutL [Erwinia tracheiphila]UIA83914.1 DNA mismatch repair endonuclease MutL [Erwinia tracheiphila]UIA92496.1 DNA mismatch repair endonuclease MutL [Erwinia tracheiphila]